MPGRTACFVSGRQCGAHRRGGHPDRHGGAAHHHPRRPGCLVIDLASKPGGVDLEAAARLGVKVIWALSLPGKVAPVTAGKSIKITIYNILHELGV